MMGNQMPAILPMMLFEAMANRTAIHTSALQRMPPANAASKLSPVLAAAILIVSTARPFELYPSCPVALTSSTMRAAPIMLPR